MFYFCFIRVNGCENARLALGSEDAELYGFGDCLALVGDIQFSINVVCVLLDRAWGDEQPG
jgi:hypothetical protein